MDKKFENSKSSDLNRYKKLTLMHSNDMHGDFLAEHIDNRLVGGVSMLSGYISKVRSEEENALYCIAGDMFRGSVIDSEYLGLSTIQIMNMLAPDVVTIGNHETDYGIAHLLFIEKCAQFPIINANLYIKQNGVRLFNPCKIIEIGGIKILFIGVITEHVLAQTKNENIIGTFVDVEDAAKEVGKICNAYNAVDVDLTVLLTHIGFEEDKKLANLLDNKWGVDIIIGGHSHTFLTEPEVVNDILIVQAGTGTDQVGRFDLIIDSHKNKIDSYKWQPIPIIPEMCPRDLKIEELIMELKNPIDAKYSKVLTHFKRTLTHPERTMQTELGNLFADILRDSLRLDIMLVGSGSIRTKLLGPIVTYKDFLECFPYEGNVYLLNVSGEQLKRMLLYMYRDEVWEGVHSEFYQVSNGLRCIYSKSIHKIVEISLNGKPIDDKDIFSLGLQQYHFNNFINSFGFDSEEIENSQNIKVISTSDRQILIEYITQGLYKEDVDLSRQVIEE